MQSICFYFKVHQPYRLKTYRFFDICNHHEYFDDYANKFIMQQMADKCYLKANEILLKLIKKYKKKFKVSFSISGIALEQFEMYAPEVLESFKKLADTGCVEFLAETYNHSLASLYSKEEFESQIKSHAQVIEKHFNQKPKTFKNTALIYSDDIGNMVYNLGFRGMITEGAKHVLGWKSPNFAYCSPSNPKLKLLLRNYQLSDDIALRFSRQDWSEWPLTAEKFVGWLNQLNSKEENVNIFLNYETFGENQKTESGIFEFLKALPETILKKSKFSFKTPSELISSLQPVSPLHVPYYISWIDEEKDITPWTGNEMQQEALNKLYSVEDKIKNNNNQKLLNDWNYLQTSNNFFYMSTKWFSDMYGHRPFNPFNSPYDAFINYMNVLSDLMIRVEEKHSETNTYLNK